MKYRKRASSIGCAFNSEAIERMLEMKFKKKPVEIEANKVTAHRDDPEGFQKLAYWCGGIVTSFDNGKMGIVIKTLGGDMTAFEGDWIAKGIKGEFYPIKNEILRLTYEQIDW